MNANLEKWGFVWTPEIVLPSGELIVSEPVRNKIPAQGIDHLAGLILGTSALIGNWYIGLVEQNYVPTDASVAADLPAIECQAYTAAQRILWEPDSSGGVIDNINDRAEFEMTADKRIYAAFLVAAAAKGSGTGPLFSIARFPSPYDVTAGSTMRLRVATVLVSN